MTDSPQPRDITVVMPALNEEANIAQAIGAAMEAFRTFGLDAEIVAVNDGSADQTEAIMRRKAAEHPGRIRIVSHDKPRGIGASFWEGVDQAAGNIVVMFPGDNENDPNEALRYVKLLEHVDIVIPFIFNREARSPFRNFLSYVYRFIVNSTFLVNFNYTNGTVLYRKSILTGLESRSDGFFFQTDILIRAVKRGYLFAEVPYRVGIRKTGGSKAISFPSLWKVMRGYARLVRDHYFHKHASQAPSFASDSQTAARRKEA